MNKGLPDFRIRYGDVVYVSNRRWPMSLNHYVKVACENPARVWQMYPKKGAIRLGSDGDVVIVDMNKEMNT